MSLLSTKKLGKTFGGLAAVSEVDFQLEDGEIHAIIGPNGAGKTTLASLLCGRLESTSGSILFKEMDITETPAYKRVRMGIAYTFQITSIYPNLSVYDNVAIAAQGNPNAISQSLEDEISEALEKTGILRLRNDIAGSLAYGHQRLLEVAMGLALRPTLLILDEPTQGLSDHEIRDFCELIHSINKSTTVLLIEHNMQVVMSLAQRITVMDQGKVLAQGSPTEIQSNAEVQAAYLGSNLKTESRSDSA